MNKRASERARAKETHVYCIYFAAIDEGGMTTLGGALLYGVYPFGGIFEKKCFTFCVR